MARRCKSLWCHAEAAPGRDVCEWCWEHRGSYVNGMPRDPRHPWYEGPPEAAAARSVGAVPSRTWSGEAIGAHDGGGSRISYGWPETTRAVARATWHI